MLLNLEKYLDCVCEVRSLNNELLGAGVVDSVTTEDIVLAGASGHKLPLLHYNTQVKISILSKTSDFIMLVGTVFTSTDALMKVTGMVTLQQYERRNFFRINVNVEVHLYPDKPRGVQPEAAPGLRVPGQDSGVRAQAVAEVPMLSCTMCDISLGGCLLASNVDLALGQKFIIEFVLVQVTHKLHMMVCRHAKVQGEDGVEVTRFGCSFTGNRDHQIDAVCKDLFVLQRRMIQRKRGKE